MVKVYGPLMSLDASGSLGNAITFSKWKGRNLVRTRVVPSNPRSGPQVGMRAMLRFLAQYWASLSTAIKATWAERAAATNISPFNAFVSANQSRWRSFKDPSKEDPATETGVAPAAPTTTATGGIRQIQLSIVDGAQIPDWGWIIFRSGTTGFTPAYSNCVAIIPRVGTPTVHIDAGLVPGTYFYRIKGFMATGKDGTLEAEKTAAAT